MNCIIDDGHVSRIQIKNRKKKIITEAVIDTYNVDVVRHLHWCFSYGYARANINKTSIYLHQLLIPLDYEKFSVIHKDGDKMNNVETNLMVVDKGKKTFNTKLYKNNTSGVKGVGYHKRLRKWYARITYEGNTTHLGYYTKMAEAIYSRSVAEDRVLAKFYA